MEAAYQTILTNGRGGTGVKFQSIQRKIRKGSILKRSGKNTEYSVVFCVVSQGLLLLMKLVKRGVYRGSPEASLIDEAEDAPLIIIFY